MKQKKIIISEMADIETSSENYASRFTGEAGEYFLTVQKNIVLDLLKYYPNSSILDVGGGHAQLAPPLVENGFKVTVASSDDSCRKRLDKFLTAESFDFLTCNLLDLPFDNDSFDVVICFRLLAHEKNWKLQISELCRVAKFAVIIDYPDKRSFNIFYDLLFRWKKKIEKNTRTYYDFSRKDIIKEFEKNKFVNITFKPEYFLPMVLHRIMNRAVISQTIENFFRSSGLTRIFGSPVIVLAESNLNEENK